MSLAESDRDGRVGGRRPKLSTHQQQEIISAVISGQKTGAEVARLFSVHPSTATRLLSQHRKSNDRASGVVK